MEHGLSRMYLWKSNSIKLYFFLQCEGSCRPRLGIGKYVSKPGLTILRKKSVRNSKLFSKWVTGTFDNGGAAACVCVRGKRRRNRKGMFRKTDAHARTDQNEKLDGDIIIFTGTSEFVGQYVKCVCVCV